MVQVLLYLIIEFGIGRFALVRPQEGGILQPRSPPLWD